MSKVKAIAAALLISVCASTISFAEVNNFHEEDINWKIDYPVVTVGRMKAPKMLLIVTL